MAFDTARSSCFLMYISWTFGARPAVLYEIMLSTYLEILPLTLFFRSALYSLMRLLILSFMLSRAPLSEILRNVPNLFLSDREHTITAADGLKKTLYLFYMIYNETPASRVIVPFYAALVTALLLDRKRQQRRKAYLLGGLLLWTAYTMAFKHDLESGTREVHDFGAGHVPGEFVFVPRAHAKAEDDGWLMGYVVNTAAETTDLVVLDAQNFAGTPQAVVHIPHRIPPGFHGNWVAN